MNCTDFTRAALMFVDYNDAHVGMGIKAMKSFGRPRGTEIVYCVACPVQ